MDVVIASGRTSAVGIDDFIGSGVRRHRKAQGAGYGGEGPFHLPLPDRSASLHSRTMFFAKHVMPLLAVQHSSSSRRHFAADLRRRRINRTQSSGKAQAHGVRSEEHTSELQQLMRSSYA